MKAIWKTLKIQVKLILNQLHESTCDYLFITCRAKFCIKDNFQGLAIAYTGLPFIIKEEAMVVARGKPGKIVSKKQQVQFIQSNFFTNKPRVI